MTLADRTDSRTSTADAAEPANAEGRARERLHRVRIWLGDHRREVAAGILVAMMVGMVLDASPTSPQDAGQAEQTVEFESIDDLFAELDASLPESAVRENSGGHPDAADEADERHSPAAAARQASYAGDPPQNPTLRIPVFASDPTPGTPQTTRTAPRAASPPVTSSSAAPGGTPPIRFTGGIRTGP